MRTSLLARCLAALTCLVLAGCGTDATAPDPTGTDPATAEVGGPADASEAERVVQLDALDTLAYTPDTIAVSAGEAVTFEVTNVGSAVHEFVIGDDETQAEHEEEMAAMADHGMAMGDEPNAIAIEPGETRSITWRFGAGEQLQYACHQLGHYAGGMVGTFTEG